MYWDGFLFVFVMVLVTVGVAVFFILWWGWWSYHKNVDGGPRESVWRNDDFLRDMSRREWKDEVDDFKEK